MLLRTPKRFDQKDQLHHFHKVLSSAVDLSVLSSVLSVFLLLSTLNEGPRDLRLGPQMGMVQNLEPGAPKSM